MTNRTRHRSCSPATANVEVWKAQEYDTDCEGWNDMDHDGAQGYDKAEVLREAKYQANKCAYRVRVRVVEA